MLTSVLPPFASPCRFFVSVQQPINEEGGVPHANRGQHANQRLPHHAQRPLLLRYKRRFSFTSVFLGFFSRKTLNTLTHDYQLLSSNRGHDDEHAAHRNQRHGDPPNHQGGGSEERHGRNHSHKEDVLWILRSNSNAPKLTAKGPTWGSISELRSTHTISLSACDCEIVWPKKVSCIKIDGEGCVCSDCYKLVTVNIDIHLNFILKIGSCISFLCWHRSSKTHWGLNRASTARPLISL